MQKVCKCVFANNTITKHSDSKKLYSIASTAIDKNLIDIFSARKVIRTCLSDNISVILVFMHFADLPPVQHSVRR